MSSTTWSVCGKQKGERWCWLSEKGRPVKLELRGQSSRANPRTFLVEGAYQKVLLELTSTRAVWSLANSNFPPRDRYSHRTSYLAGSICSRSRRIRWSRTSAHVRPTLVSVLMRVMRVRVSKVRRPGQIQNKAVCVSRSTSGVGPTRWCKLVRRCSELIVDAL